MKKDAADLPELTEADKFVLQWLQERAPLMQDENGINLERIRGNLQLTPLERVRKTDEATAGISFLRQRTPARPTDGDSAHSAPPFVQLLKTLFDHQIDCVLVGGIALMLYGTNTAGVEPILGFVFDTTPANCQKLEALLNEAHARPLAFPPNTQFQVTPGLLARVKFLNLKTDLGAIDLLPLPDGIDSFAGLWERAEIKDYGEFSFPIASVEDLIAMKKAANRPKDQIHLMELYALQRVLHETPPA